MPTVGAGLHHMIWLGRADHRRDEFGDLNLGSLNVRGVPLVGARTKRPRPGVGRFGNGHDVNVCFSTTVPPIRAAANFAAISEVLVDAICPASSRTSHVVTDAARACWFATTLLPQHMIRTPFRFRSGAGTRSRHSP